MNNSLLVSYDAYHLSAEMLGLDDCLDVLVFRIRRRCGGEAWTNI